MSLMLVLVWGLIAGLSSGGQAGSSVTRDDAAVRDIVKQYVEARERRDAGQSGHCSPRMPTS